MTMTKKDYELIARVIKKNLDDIRKQYDNLDDTNKAVAYRQYTAIEQLAADFSAEFREINPLYDAHKFMTAAIYN